MKRETAFFLVAMGVVAVVLLVLLHPTARAQGVTKTAEAAQVLIFAWDQTTDDLTSLDGWRLYIRAETGGAAESTVDVVYTGGSGPFTSSQSFTVTGKPGAVVRKYFVLDAVSKNGTRTDVSNEVFWDFQIPFANVTTPMNLTVKAEVGILKKSK